MAVRVDMSQMRQAQDGQTTIEAGSRSTVTVTIRMPTAMIEALKREAEQQNVRGYQTLMKRWIEDRLTGDRVIAARRLGPVLRQLEDAERELQRLMAEAHPDH